MTHGTYASYNKRGCRCAACSLAKKIYVAEQTRRERGYVDATESRRQLRALSKVLGKGKAAQECGLAPFGGAWKLLTGRTTHVRMQTARQIADAYEFYLGDVERFVAVQPDKLRIEDAKGVLGPSLARAYNRTLKRPEHVTVALAERLAIAAGRDLWEVLA